MNINQSVDKRSFGLREEMENFMYRTHCSEYRVIITMRIAVVVFLFLFYFFFLLWLLYDFELGMEAQAAEARTPPSSDHMSPCEFLTGPVKSLVPQQISYF